METTVHNLTGALIMPVIEYRYIIRHAVSQKTVGAVYAANASEAIEGAMKRFAVTAQQISVERTTGNG